MQSFFVYPKVQSYQDVVEYLLAGRASSPCRVAWQGSSSASLIRVRQAMDINVLRHATSGHQRYGDSLSFLLANIQPAAAQHYVAPVDPI